MIKLDLLQTYTISTGIINATDWNFEFDAPQRDDSIVTMHVKISQHTDPQLINVYNMSLGPLASNGTIDDQIRLKHDNSNKVFSTAIFIAYFFLQENPSFIIGLDGSNDLRANLYHGMFVLNKEPMDGYFVSVGVDWYVKLLRNNDVERDDSDIPLFKPLIEPFNYSRTRHDLYRYYMIHLK